MCRPDEFLLLFGQISAEKLGPVREHPGVPILDLYASKDIRGILVELVLHGLTGIWRNCSNVDEAGDALIDSGGGDGGSPVAVPDQESRAANSVERPLHHSDVLFKIFQAVLDRDHLVAIRLQCGG